MICPKPPARFGRFNAFLATFMHLMVLREADADYPEFIDGEAAENNAPESGNESENESESNVNPPLQPNRDQRRATTRNMFDTAFQNGAIIDGTTVFTFTQQPQTSTQSTTTTYNATFPGPDGRPKNVFIALFRAVSGGGNPLPTRLHTNSYIPAVHIPHIRSRVRPAQVSGQPGRRCGATALPQRGSPPPSGKARPSPTMTLIPTTAS